MPEDMPQPMDASSTTEGAEIAPSSAMGAQSTSADSSGGETEFLRQEDLDALLASAGADSFGSVGGGGATNESPVSNPVEATFDLPNEPVESAYAAAATPPPVRAFEFPDLGTTTTNGIDAKRVSLLNDVHLRVKIELGRTRMLVEEVLKLGEGSVVELDKLAGDPVDVYANERLVARGEVLVLDDSFCVRINEVISRDPHRVIQ